MQEYQLVPKQMVGMLGQINQMQMSPNMDSMIRLDNEMDGILKNKNLTTDQKYALYQEALERYLTFRSKQTSKNEYQPTQHLGIKRNVESELIGILPDIATKSKASQLLNVMKTKPDLLRWDDDGKLYYKNRNIQNANIVDIVYDLVNPYSKKRNPKGIKEIQYVLEELNVPDAYIDNHMRKSYNRKTVDSKAVSADIKKETNSIATITDAYESKSKPTSPTINITRNRSPSPIWSPLKREKSMSRSPSPRLTRAKVRGRSRSKMKRRSQSDQKGDGIPKIRFKPYIITDKKWTPYI
jgi:hypothetical protein